MADDKFAMDGDGKKGALQRFLYFKPIFLILLDTVDWLIFKGIGNFSLRNHLTNFFYKLAFSRKLDFLRFLLYLRNEVRYRND